MLIVVSSRSSSSRSGIGACVDDPTENDDSVFSVDSGEPLLLTG